MALLFFLHISTVNWQSSPDVMTMAMQVQWLFW
jgi:hypothetical protein